MSGARYFRHLRRWLYNRLFRDLVSEQVSLTLIRWRKAGNLDGKPLDAVEASLAEVKRLREALIQTAREFHGTLHVSAYSFESCPNHRCQYAVAIARTALTPVSPEPEASA